MKMYIKECDTCLVDFTTVEEHRTMCLNCIQDHKLKPNGYLPGRYKHKCFGCKKEFEGAKGSQLCRECAVKSYNKAQGKRK